SSFLMSKRKVAMIFKEIVRDELIPLDVINVFEEFNEETLLKICKGNYLGLLSTGQLSKTGAFYTPDYVVEGMVQDHVIFANTKVLDPCCGSGAFLIKTIHRLKELGVKDWNSQVLGIEIDKASALCAKLNILFEMDEDNAGFPNVVEGDALDDSTWQMFENVDLIVSNPPWGAKFESDRKKDLKKKFSSAKSSESFSFFMLQSMEHIREGGVVSFLAPESILNVKSHRTIRSILLKKTLLDIHRMGRAFDDVFTDVIRVSVRKSPSIGKNLVNVSGNNGTFTIKQDFLAASGDLEIIPEKTPEHVEVLGQIEGQENFFLKDNADWALGVVTGNNSKFLSDSKFEDYEPVLKGKDLSKFEITEPEMYMHFNPKDFQQCANPEMYRAKEKLIYKFISKKLCFVRDEKGYVTLNSANVVIPKLPIPLKLVCAFLNSNLAQYFYQINFGSLKVLRGFVEQLPLPNLKDDDFSEALRLATKLEENPADSDAMNEMNSLMYGFYGLTANQILLVEKFIQA
ncbi:N-6 DNA methylase, partial [bacterium]|nr:N-6 DNA methylase [bacterium]